MEKRSYRLISVDLIVLIIFYLFTYAIILSPSYILGEGEFKQRLMVLLSSDSGEYDESEWQLLRQWDKGLIRMRLLEVGSNNFHNSLLIWFIKKIKVCKHNHFLRIYPFILLTQFSNK